MLLYHLKIAWRALRKNKLFSGLNILGLATGLACSLFIFLWVKDELSIDQFHKNIDQLYFVELMIEGWDNSVVTPAPLASTLLQEYPDITNSARLTYFGDGKLLAHGDKSHKEKGIETDTSFFEMFSFRFKYGNPAMPFAHQQSIVINEQIAEKFFSGENPIGKTLKLDNGQDFTVTAVLENIPSNSSLQFDFAIPFKTFVASENDNQAWGAWFCATIIQLNSQTTGEDFISDAAGFTNLYQKINKPKWKSRLIPLAEVYFYDNMQPFLSKTGNIHHNQIFSIAGILIFIVTCLNFLSLSTSQFVRQFKQANIRKVMGASYKEMSVQYFTEALTIGLFSALAAFLFLIALEPLFFKISGKQLLFWSTQPVLLLGGMVLVISLIASCIPAFFLRTKALISLQNIQNLKPGGIALRKSLVVFQFAVTGCLIVCTLVLQNQLSYIQKKDVGYQKENLLSISLPQETNDKIPFIKNELLRHPLISNVTTSTFEYIYFDTKITEWEGKNSDESLTIRPMTAEQDFLKTFSIEVKDGRFYDPEINDSTAIVINQTAAQKMGLSDPIGKKVQLPWEKEKRTIVGVVNDFNYWELTREIEPLFILEGNSGNLYVRIDEQNKQQTLSYIQNIISGVNPSYPFEYTFLDDRYDLLHVSQHQTGAVFKVFAGVSILIACLSLFAMATFTAERRTKEIGIRKVNGASVSQIFRLLSNEFIKLIVFSFLIAAPIAYIIMQQWLENFAYSVEISWWVFLIAGMMTLVITLLTVSSQAIKAAKANPVKSLRSE